MENRGFGGVAGALRPALLAGLLCTFAPPLSTASSPVHHHETAFCALTNPAFPKGRGLAQCIHPQARGNIRTSNRLRMGDEDTRDERAVLGASATFAELVLADRGGAMAVAGIRAQAFARMREPSPEEFIGAETPTNHRQLKICEALCAVVLDQQKKKNKKRLH